MKKEISTPVAVVMIVVVLLVAGLAFWWIQKPKGSHAAYDDKGIPMIPEAGQAGAKQMRDFYQSGAMPSANPSQGNAPNGQPMGAPPAPAPSGP